MPPFPVKALRKNIHGTEIGGKKFEMIRIAEPKALGPPPERIVIAVYHAEDGEWAVDGYHIATQPKVVTFKIFERIYPSVAKKVERFFFKDMVRKPGVVCEKCGHSSKIRSEQRRYKDGRKRACHKCHSTKLRYTDVPEPDAWIIFGFERIQT